MSNVIKLKRGTGSNPSASDLVVGEVALRTDNAKLFTKKDDGNIAEIGTGLSDGDKGDLTISNSGTTFTIDNGVINNAKVASDAAIAGSKISPVFTSNATIQNTHPKLFLTDTNNNSDFSVENVNGVFKIIDQTNSTTRFQIISSGITNIEAPLNVNGNFITSGTATINGGNLTISGTSSFLKLNDTDNNPDYKLFNIGGVFQIFDDTNAEVRLKISTGGNVQIPADNKKFQIGASNDLFLEHDGNNSVFRNTTGDLYIQDNSAGNIYIQPVNNQTSITAVANGRVELGFAGTKRFETTSTGIDVNGSVTANDIITAGALLHEGDTDTLVHFSAANTIELKTGGATRMTANNYGVLLNSTLNVNGNRIILGDSTSGATHNRIVLGNDNDLFIYHDSNNSYIENATGNFSILGDTILLKNAANSESFIRCVNNGVELYHSNSLKLGTFSGGINLTGNLNVSAGIDVTGDITVTGTVDGVDIAARNTLFGGLTSSSGVLTDGVTATTQAQSDNSTKVSTTAYVRTAVSNLVNSAPSTLDTLKELSDALGADANFSTTVTNSIATKLPLAGGTLTGNLTISSNKPTIVLTEGDANPDYQIFSQGGAFKIKDSTNAADRLVVNTDGHVDILGNLDVGAGIDVTGNITTTNGSIFQSNSGGSENSFGTNINITTTYPSIHLNDTDSDNDFKLQNQNGVFAINDDDANANRLTIASDGTTTIAQNLNVGAGLDVTGNITVTGTVDGRDLATDGSKLDGIESGATADQTASELLTLIKTVDGSGSGLDADTLDGIQGASLLRSDANDTYTGTLSLAGHIVDSGDSRSVKLMGGTTNSQPFLGIGEQSLYGMKIRWDSNSAIRFDGFWNTSVDGTPNKTLGSINVNTATWSIPAATFSNGINVGDLNNGGITGSNYNITGVNSLAFNDPGEGLIFKDGLTLILIDDANDNICNFDGAAELRVNGSKVWTASNDGSGSGLNADKVDGVEASSFLRSDANDSASGTITFADEKGIRLSHTNQSDGNDGVISAGRFGSGLNIVGTQTTAGTGRQVRIWGEVLTSGGDKFWNASNDGSGSGLDSDKLDGQEGSYYRNAGNINAGTLNAARLPNHSAALLTSGTLPAARLPNHSAALLTSGTIPDARISSNFLKSDATANSNLNTNNPSGVYRINTGITNGHSNMSSYGTLLVCNNVSDTGFQIYAEYGQNDYFIRGGNSSTFGGSGTNRAWAKIWNDQNDGAGSNLDADKVDGLQASQFVRSDTNDTMTGTLTIGDGSAQTELHIKKADNNVADHLQFYNGTTRIGEIGCEDTTWLRINQETNKNIYTPRYIRADGGFFVDGATKGINGSGNFTGGTISGASDYNTLIRSNADDNVSGHTEWQDNYQVRLGNGADMRLYHNGSQSYIDNHTSHLYIRNAGSNDNANIYIQARDGENSIICEDDADVRLFSDNTEVFRTDTTNSCKVKHLYPWTNNAYNLGSTSLRWKNLYVQDMHFHNGEENPNKVDGTWGDWTLQEGENDIFMINNRSGKKFKIAMIPV